MLEAILILFLSYIVTGVWYYLYAVVKSYELMGFWSWHVEDGYIGVCIYPKWLLFWLRGIVRKFEK